MTSKPGHRKLSPLCALLSGNLYSLRMLTSRFSIFLSQKITTAVDANFMCRFVFISPLALPFAFHDLKFKCLYCRLPLHPGFAAVPLVVGRLYIIKHRYTNQIKLTETKFSFFRANVCFLIPERP